MIERRSVFTVLALAAALSITAFPLTQLFGSPGHIFYRNGLDEGHYLVYEVSKVASAQLVRPSQKLVSAFHEAGFSGGEINFIFDLAVNLILILLLRGILRRIALFSNAPGLYTFLFLFLPLFFNTFNPLVEDLRNFNLESKSIFWFTMPDDNHYVFARTPEPQFSYLLLAAAAYAALRVKKIWPIFLVLPAIYNFVLIPVGFAALTIALLRWVNNIWLSAAGSYLLLSILLFIGYSLYLDPEVAGLLVETHLPLISFTGCLAAIFHLLLGKKLPQRERVLSFALTMAIWQTANTQVICGILAAPSNYEQYFGVLVLSFQVCLAVSLFLKERLPVVVAAASAVFVIAMIKDFYYNYDLIKRLPPSPKLLSDLRHDAGEVAINNLELGLSYNLVFPKQSDTLFSYGRIYFWNAERNLKSYLCAREVIKNSPEHVHFEKTITILNQGYQKRSEDNPINHLYRKEAGIKSDIYKVPDGCRADVKIYLEKPRF